MAANFGFSFDVAVTGATNSAVPGATKPKADRYRVVRSKYYMNIGPVDLKSRKQCVRCNELLGARATRLYTDGQTFVVEPSATHDHVADMGVFCAVTALERGEKVPADSFLEFVHVDKAEPLYDVGEFEGEEA